MTLAATPLIAFVASTDLERSRAFYDGVLGLRELEARGVTFRRYAGVEQDEQGMWTAPNGARVAWFSDPDGNTLSVAQFPG